MRPPFARLSLKWQVGAFRLREVSSFPPLASTALVKRYHSRNIKSPPPNLLPSSREKIEGTRYSIEMRSATCNRVTRQKQITIKCRHVKNKSALNCTYCFTQNLMIIIFHVHFFSLVRLRWQRAKKLSAHQTTHPYHTAHVDTDTRWLLRVTPYYVTPARVKSSKCKSAMTLLRQNHVQRHRKSNN